MQKFLKVTVVVVALIFSTVLFLHASSDDPIVSKTYLDKVIGELKNELIAKIENTNSNNSASNTTNVAASFNAVQFTSGQKIIFQAGTEFILRSGTAKVIDPTGNGLSDLTGGKNVLNNNLVGLNHLMIVPRSDGRGVVVTANAWLMVKGSYEVVEN